MKIEKKSRSMNFLVEMLIVLLFFSLSMLICVQLFVGASRRSELASDYSSSMLIVESVVEKLKVEGLDGVQKELGGNWEENRVLVLNMNETGCVDDEEGAYRLSISEIDQQISERMVVYDVKVIRNYDEELLNEFQVGYRLDEGEVVSHE